MDMERQMRKCRNCNVYVDESQSTCPLCGAQLGEKITTPLSYPTYREKKSVWRFILKTATFLSIAAVMVCVFINIFTYSKIEMLWSLYVALGLFLAWGMSINWTSRRRFLPKKLFSTYLHLSFFTVCVDILSGFDMWSTTYVVPGLSIALVLTYLGIMMGSKRLYKKFFGYMMFSFFSTIIPVIINLLGFSEIRWLSMLPLLIYLLAVVGLFVFSGKRMRSEMKKRFKL